MFTRIKGYIIKFLCRFKDEDVYVVNVTKICDGRESTETYFFDKFVDFYLKVMETRELREDGCDIKVTYIYKR